VPRIKQLLWAVILQAGSILLVHSEPTSIPPERPLPQNQHDSASKTESKRSLCQSQLADIAEFKPAPPITGPGECTAIDPVNVEAVLLPANQRVAFTPMVALQCSMALAVARWIRGDVVPTLDKFGLALRGVETLESYGCRTFNGVKGAKLSEHGHANALDVQSLKLSDGTILELTNARVSKALREQLRQTACSRFSTVLGNGADGFHENHVHIDLMQRTNDYKICQWNILDPTEVAPIAQKNSIVPEASAPSSATGANDVPLPQPRPPTNAEGHGSVRQSTERLPQPPDRPEGHLDDQTAMVGPWTIRTSVKSSNERCAITRAVDGVDIEFAKAREGWRLLLQSQKWKLENGKAYEVRLVAGSRSVEAKALAQINSVTIPIDNWLIEVVSTADVLRVMGAGATLTVPLDGSATALAQLGMCLNGSSRVGVDANPFVAPATRLQRAAPTRPHRRWSGFSFFR
jgi:hypothetical protein